MEPFFGQSGGVTSAAYVIWTFTLFWRGEGEGVGIVGPLVENWLVVGLFCHQLCNFCVIHISSMSRLV